MKYSGWSASFSNRFASSCIDSFIFRIAADSVWSWKFKNYIKINWKKHVRWCVCTYKDIYMGRRGRKKADLIGVINRCLGNNYQHKKIHRRCNNVWPGLDSRTGMQVPTWGQVYLWLIQFYAHCSVFVDAITKSLYLKIWADNRLTCMG